MRFIMLKFEALLRFWHKAGFMAKIKALRILFYKHYWRTKIRALILAIKALPKFKIKAGLSIKPLLRLVKSFLRRLAKIDWIGKVKNIIAGIRYFLSFWFIVLIPLGMFLERLRKGFEGIYNWPIKVVTENYKALHIERKIVFRIDYILELVNKDDDWRVRMGLVGKWHEGKECDSIKEALDDYYKTVPTFPGSLLCESEVVLVTIDKTKVNAFWRQQQTISKVVLDKNALFEKASSFSKGCVECDF